MVSVPRNTYLTNLRQPTGIPISTDPAQFTGASVIFTKDCPKRHSLSTGLDFCGVDNCINSCPHLNPKILEARREQLSQAMLFQSRSEEALNTTQARLDAAASVVNVTGSHTFIIPSRASSNDLAIVMGRIETELPTYFDFSLDVLVRFVSFHTLVSVDRCLVSRHVGVRVCRTGQQCSQGVLHCPDLESLCIYRWSSRPAV